jgi:PAS domain S-box-containing protein
MDKAKKRSTRIFYNLLGYLVAVASVALATWLKFLAQPTIIPADVPILYLLAIVPTAIFFGFGQALLVCVLSFLAYDYYFIPPIHQITFDITETPIVVIFLVVGVLFSYLASNLREKNRIAAREITARKQSEAELITYRDHLEELVQQRTSDLEKTNLALKEEISEHKKDEEALRQSEQRWATTLASIGDGVVATDISGKVSFMNTVAEALTGWKTVEANQKPISEVFNIINETTRQKAENPVDKVLQQGIICSLANHTILIRKDGSEISIDDSGAPIKNMEGVTKGVVLVFRDITERRKAEKALHQMEQRNKFLADILERAPQPFGIGLPDGQLGIVNKAFCELTGYTADELRTLDWVKVLTPPEYMAMEAEKLNELVRTGQPVRYEKEYIRKDNSRVPIELLVSVDRGSNGQVEYYYSFLTDITERRKAEEALKESEAKANALIKYAPTGIYELDYRTQCFLSVNDAMSVLTGYTKEELFALGPSAMLDEDSKKLFADRIRRQLAGEKIDDSVEYKVKKKDGSTLWITLNIAFSNDNPNIALVIGHDITERIEAQNKLTESEDKFSKAFHSSPVGLVITHLPDGRWVDANDTYLKMLEYTREEAMGHTSSDLKIYPDADKRAQIFRILKEEGKIRDIELSLRTKTGRIIETLSSVEKITLLGEEYSLSTNVDITLLKKSQEELKRRSSELEASNKELEAFSYSVSHDLRAPLRSITGFSAILLEDYGEKLDREGQQYLKKIQDSGELMGQLMDDLLKLSRVTRSDLSMEKLDLSGMAQEIISDLEATEPKRKVKVTTAPNMIAEGDKNLLSLVLQNLLGNAWKFTSKTVEPRIEIGIIEHKDKQAFFVRDNGSGFDMVYANKLFQPFQRLHKASEFAGTGIGLATVQRIIRRHGGEVWAEGKVGQGATFYFTLA